MSDDKLAKAVVATVGVVAKLVDVSGLGTSIVQRPSNEQQLESVYQTQVENKADQAVQDLADLGYKIDK